MTEIKKMERFVITRAYSQMDIVIVEVDPDKHRFSVVEVVRKGSKRCPR